MSASSFSVPSSVFTALSALPGPVAVVGSRQLPPAALQSVARLGRWVGRNHRPLWSGGALGTDSAASAGALCQGGSVRWWLPASCSALPAGSQQPSVRGPAGTFPLSAPRTLARSVSCLSFAGGPAAVPYHVRLFQRTRTMLLSLQGQPQTAIVAFLSHQALASGKGGTWYTVRHALKLGFVPGQSLFVIAVTPSAFQAVSPEAVRHSFLLASPQQLTFQLPPGVSGAGPGLNWSRSPAAGRRDPHGERYDSQTTAGPLSQAFWLGLRFPR